MQQIRCNIKTRVTNKTFNGKKREEAATTEYQVRRNTPEETHACFNILTLNKDTDHRSIKSHLYPLLLYCPVKGTISTYVTVA